MKKIVFLIMLLTSFVFGTPIAQTDKRLGSFTGDGGTDAGDSVYADMVLAQVDLDAILADTSAFDTGGEYATALWNALAASYGGAGTYGQALEDLLAKVPLSDGAVSWNATALAAIEGEATDSIEADFLDKLIAADDRTASLTYPDSVASESILAFLMSKSASPVKTSYNNTTDSLEAIRDNMDTQNTADQVDLDAILADTALWDTTAELQTILFGSATAGSTATALATAQADLDILTGATGANLLTATQASIDAIEADTAAMDTASELQALAGTIAMERSISKTVSTIANGANNLFAVAGGPIKITEIVAYVTTTAIGAETCTISYNIDPTTPATDTAFGITAPGLEINADAVGTLYTWDGVLATDLTEVTNGVALAMGTDVSYGLIAPIGMVELTAVHDGEITGEITVYMTYIPLSASTTVTAQ